MVDKVSSTDIFVGGLENFQGNARAAGAINAGDVVEYDGTTTGTTPDVQASATTGEPCAGVALTDAAAAGDPVTIAQTGAEVRVNFSGSTAATPGVQLVSAGNGSALVAGTAGHAVIGQATSDSSGGEVAMLVTLGGDFHG